MLKCPFIIHVLCLRVCSTICLASIFRNYLPRWAIVCVLFCSLWEISLNKSKSHIESQLRLEPSGGRGRGELLFQSITEPKHFTYRKTYFEKNNMYLFFFFNNKKSPESVLWFECSLLAAANEQNPSWCLLSRVSWEVLGILRCNIWEQGGGLSLAGVCPAGGGMRCSITRPGESWCGHPEPVGFGAAALVPCVRGTRFTKGNEKSLLPSQWCWLHLGTK